MPLTTKPQKPSAKSLTRCAATVLTSQPAQRLDVASWSGLRLSINAAIDRRSSATVANTRSRSARLSRTGTEYWARVRHHAVRTWQQRPLTWSGPRAVFQVGQNRKLGGRVTTGNSPAHVYRRLFRANAASAQPPHMSMKLSISRTTSSLVYGRPYPRIGEPTTEFSAQRSLAMAASTSSANSAAIGDRGSGRPSRVCTRAARVMLEISQTPWAATRSATRSAR